MHNKLPLWTSLLLTLLALAVPIPAYRRELAVEDRRKFAVIFDAGSSGSRVHVFCFDDKVDLVPITKDSKELDHFVKIKPGLSAYANDSQAAANSLVPLLNEAERVVPEEFRANTPIVVAATAGLRLLQGNAADKILQSVRDLLKNRSSLKYDDNQVSILSGSQEGSYMWIAVNFLLGNLGKEYQNTVGVVDLGGGSVQMTYAISETAAAKAPILPAGEDPYVKKLLLRGTRYYVYVHSYLHYGIYAARVEILKASNSSTNPCILAGYNGIYHYGGQDYKASASPSGSSLQACRRVALRALKVNEPCKHRSCSFSGVWSGGGGDGQRVLFIASSFYGIATEVGIIDPTAHSAEVRPLDFLAAAEHACMTKYADSKSKYPLVDEVDLPYVCMDIVYQYSLLVNGFGLDPKKNITVANDIKYHDSLVGVAWPLGIAIELVSPMA